MTTLLKVLFIDDQEPGFREEITSVRADHVGSMAKTRIVEVIPVIYDSLFMADTHS